MIQAALIALIAFLAYMGDALGYSQYDRPLCTGVLVGIAITTGSGIEGAVALSLPIATFALLIKQVIYTFVRGFFVHRADSYALQGNDSKVAAMHVWSTLAYCVPMAIVVGICFYVGGPAVQAVLDQIPAFIMKGLSAASGMLPALGFAMLVKMIISKELAPYFFIGFLIASYLQIPVLGIACIAILIALLVIMNDRKKNNVEMGGMDDNEF